MQQFNGEQWEAQYRFTLQPHALSDFIERCYYFQHSPESHFFQNRMCSLATSAGRITLSGGGRPGAVAGATGASSPGVPAGGRPGAVAGATPQSRDTASGLKLITTVNGQREEQALASEEEYQRVLAERFGIVL
jgi:arylamine N-acetyltransferase